jgi:hypothetical protein
MCEPQLTPQPPKRQSDGENRRKGEKQSADLRTEHPDFDQFVIEAIADSASVGLRLSRQRKQNAAKRDEINDYHRIRTMLPPNFPGRHDVVSDIFEATLDGSLRRRT